MTRLERFESRIAKGTRCWAWTGASQGGGYSQFYDKGKNLLAHRVSYELYIGPIPTGMTIDHLCRNRACVNPAHMEPVSNGENILRGVSFSARNARKTQCDSGHEFTLENTYRWRNGRHCRACRRFAVQKYRAAGADSSNSIPVLTGINRRSENGEVEE